MREGDYVWVRGQVTRIREAGQKVSVAFRVANRLGTRYPGSSTTNRVLDGVVVRVTEVPGRDVVPRETPIFDDTELYALVKGSHRARAAEELYARLLKATEGVHGRQKLELVLREVGAPPEDGWRRTGREEPSLPSDISEGADAS